MDIIFYISKLTRLRDVEDLRVPCTLTSSQMRKRSRGSALLLKRVALKPTLDNFLPHCIRQNTVWRCTDQLILGIENTTCGHQCNPMSCRLQKNHSRGASTASACFCQGGTGRAPWPSWGCTGWIPSGATAFPLEYTTHNAAIRCNIAI